MDVQVKRDLKPSKIYFFRKLLYLFIHLALSYSQGYIGHGVALDVDGVGQVSVLDHLRRLHADHEERRFLGDASGALFLRHCNMRRDIGSNFSVRRFQLQRVYECDKSDRKSVADAYALGRGAGLSTWTKRRSRPSPWPCRCPNPRRGS